MGECKKCTPLKRPWCYSHNGSIYSGMYSHECIDGEIANIRYEDKDGDYVNPADYRTVDCVDCEDSQPVYICGGKVETESSNVQKICLKRKGGEYPVIHGFVQALKNSENGLSVSIWDSRGNPLSVDDYDISSCC